LKRSGSAAGRSVALLTLAFALRIAFLDLALPYGDPLDEPFHLAYASYLSQTGRLPKACEASVAADVLRPLSGMPRSAAYGPPWFGWGDFARLAPEQRQRLRDDAYRFDAVERAGLVSPNYETQQPPLFYLLAAALLRRLPRTPLDRQLLSLRLFAAACAACAVPLWYRFLRKLLPKPAALTAVAACVALPGVASLVGRFTNDALALPIGASLLFLLVDVARGRLDRTRTFLLGLTLAAGCWTKLYFLPLLPAPMLASACAPSARRGVTFRRAAAAAALAFLLFLPWIARQHRDTGDWLGLTPSKRAVERGIGIVQRMAEIPGALRWRYGIVFGRTFLWPGTDTAMGAPPAAALALTIALAALLLAPAISRSLPAKRTRRGGAAAALAVVLFLASEVFYTATFAAVSRAHGGTPVQLGFGWYAAILTPAVLAMGCVWGRAAPRWIWLALVALGVVVGWWLDLGVLPAAYSGRTAFNASNAPLAAYGRLFLGPAAAMKIYDTAGLAEPGAGLLGGLWAAWQALVVFGLAASARRPLARR
jgi:hypothetical protein